MNRTFPFFEFNADSARILIPAVIGIVAFGAGLWWLLRTEYVALDTPVAPAVRQEAISALQQAGIDYRTAESGAIQVADDKVKQAHGVLTDLGLSFPEPQGFELLDKADYTLSDFSQRLNYQRALEGELARTIMGLSEVRSARVHLSIPKQELFGRNRPVPKASVTLQLKENRELSDESADGIREIVASSTDGLKPENVAIIDDRGHPFAGGNAGGGLERRSQQARQLELDLERRVRQLLRDSYGVASPYVSVRADLNFDKVVSVRDDATPGDSAAGYLVREQTSDAGPSRDGNSGSSSTVREYSWGKEHVETEFATGRLVRLSIAVALPPAFASLDLPDLERVVAAAIGLRTERGDKLVVSVVPATLSSPATPAAAVSSATAAPAPASARTAATAQAGTAPAAEAHTETSFRPPVWLVPGLLLIAGLAAFAYFLRRPAAKPEPARLAPAQREQLLADLQKWLKGPQGT